MLESIMLALAMQQQALRLVPGGALAAVAPAQPAAHRVVPGDTLSAIAPLMRESWQQLYAANQKVIGGNPGLIQPGEVLRSGGPYPAHGLAVAAAYLLPPPPPPAPAVVTQAVTAQQAPSPAPQAAPVPQSAAPAAAFSGSGGMQSCIIARESGGNPGVVNASSGAGGLYQFLPSTWAALGFSGLPQDASVATQNAAYAAEVAQNGYSPWTASDGC